MPVIRTLNPLAALKKLSSQAFPDVCFSCLEKPASEDSQFCAECEKRMVPLPAPRCVGCGGTVDGITDLCGECLQYGVREWDHAVSVYPFKSLPRELVHRLKYNGQTWLLPYLGAAAAMAWKTYGAGSPDTVVPIPMHPLKKLFRGFNQAELLSDCVSEALSLKSSCILSRLQWTRSQTKLGLEERRNNTEHSFRVKKKKNLNGLHVLITDDVLTTGATLAAATRELKNAGAVRVSILTIARG